MLRWQTDCIKNVEQGTFLNSGHSLGTAAVLKSEARVFEVVNNGDGTCKIKSSLGYWKAGDETFLDGSEGDAGVFDFKDGDWWNWEKACHQDIQWTIKNVGKFEAAKFEVISLDDMKKSFASATSEAPVNASFMVKAHNKAKNDSENATAWKYTRGGETAAFEIPDPNWIYGDGDTYAFVVNDKHENELADSEDIVEQAVEGLPAGKYDVVYRVVNQTNTPMTMSFNSTVAPAVDYA